MTGRAPARRGHTLLEVVVAMVLGSALLTVVAGWAISLVGSAQQGSRLAADRTDLTAMRETLLVDVRAASACDPYTPAVAVADGATLRLWHPTVVDGQPSRSVVSWRLAGGQLQRAEQGGLSDCVLPAEPDSREWVVYARGVQKAAGEGFYGFRDGQPEPVSAEDSAPDRIVEAVGMRFTADANGVDVPVQAAESVTNAQLAITR